MKLIMMLITQPSFQLMGLVCDSSIDLGKVLTVDFTSAGTLRAPFFRDRVSGGT